MTTTEGYIQEVLRSMPAATPQRSQIALELRGHIAERLAAGQPIDEVVRQLGSPVALAESYLSAVPLVAPTLWRRFAAKVVDFLAAFIVLVPFAWWMWNTQGFWLAPLLLIVGGSLLFAAGTVLAEYWFGQTFGKWLFDLRVVRASGARIGLGQAFVRVLPVALEGVFPVDAAFVFFTDKQQRAFELLSKTRVVTASAGPVRRDVGAGAGLFTP